MHGVVAVLHEHATPVTELHGNGDASTRKQPVDVFPPLLCQRERNVIPPIVLSRKDLAFLEVDVNRVVPTAASVGQRPDLTGAKGGRRRNPTEVSRERISLAVSS